MTGQGGARADRRGIFLRALARGGSVTGAARAAGVWPATAYDWRKADAGFAAAWARARAAGRAALAAGIAGAAGAVPALADDEVVRGSKAGRPCVARVGAARWSAAMEARFLGTLAATGCVRRAIEAAGVSSAAVYMRRRRWPDFAERWQEALGQGWQRLEAALLHAATAGAGGDFEGGAGATAFGDAMTIDQALTLYKIHRHAVTGEGRRPRHDWRRREMPIEEVRAEVLRRVNALARAGGAASPAREAARPDGEDRARGAMDPRSSPG